MQEQSNRLTLLTLHLEVLYDWQVDPNCIFYDWYCLVNLHLLRICMLLHQLAHPCIRTTK